MGNTISNAGNTNVSDDLTNSSTASCDATLGAMVAMEVPENGRAKGQHWRDPEMRWYLMNEYPAYSPGNGLALNTTASTTADWVSSPS